MAGCLVTDKYFGDHEKLQKGPFLYDRSIQVSMII